MKEISYIHAEAYAAGELKHGTIALITKDVPSNRHCHPGESLFQNALQCTRGKSPWSLVILLTKESAVADSEIANVRISIPIWR